MTNVGIKEDVLTLKKETVDIEDLYRLILYNDEVNTFDWVMVTLIDICDHTAEQAEQCAWIVHTKGKYCVKSGSQKDMKFRCEALGERGLTAAVE